MAVCGAVPSVRSLPWLPLSPDLSVRERSGVGPCVLWWSGVEGNWGWLEGIQ